MNLFSRSIRMLFICNVVVLSTLLLGLLAFINAYQLSENMENELEAMLKARSGEISEIFDKRLTQVSGKTASLALNISSRQTYDMNLAGRFITALVKSDDAIFGSGLYTTASSANGINSSAQYGLRAPTGIASFRIICTNMKFDVTRKNRP